MPCDQPIVATLPLLGCCQPVGPPSLQIARAVSILSVVTFHVFVFAPLFCGRRWYRQCDVHAVDNGRCGFALEDQDSSATFPIFGFSSTGVFDPCVTFETLNRRQPFNPSDDSLTCRLAPGSSSFDCWNATFTLTVETTPDDLIAACLSNLALIDLDQVPFGVQRKVVNDPINGSPIFTDSPISTNPPTADACPSPFNHTLAASFAFNYTTIGDVEHCTNNDARRIAMPTQHLIVSASRSRFSSNANWCKRTLGPTFIDPDFTQFCVSRPGICAETACVHHLPAEGIIDLPSLNQSIHVAICTSPAAPCNSVPIPF